MNTSLSKKILLADFESIYQYEDDGIKSLFLSLERSGLRRFLENRFIIDYLVVDELFETAKVIHRDIILAQVCSQSFLFSETDFAAYCVLPTEGFTDLTYSPVVIEEMCHLFSSSNIPVNTWGPKSHLSHKYQILSEILGKSVLARENTQSYTQQVFEMMVAITVGTPVNWSRIIFDNLKGMITANKGKTGYAPQLSGFCVTLDIHSGPSVTLHPKQVLTKERIQELIDRWNKAIERKTSAIGPSHYRF